MWSVQCKTDIPIEFIEIDRISVRGSLGPLTVWAALGHWDEEVGLALFKRHSHPAARSLTEQTTDPPKDDVLYAFHI